MYFTVDFKNVINCNMQNIFECGIHPLLVIVSIKGFTVPLPSVVKLGLIIYPINEDRLQITRLGDGTSALHSRQHVVPSSSCLEQMLILSHI